MINEHILSAAADKLAALDFTDANEEIERLQVEMQDCAAAEERARTRRSEIRRELSSEGGTASGSAVADMLLEGEMSVATLSPARESLIEESNALEHGIRELRQRSGAAKAAIIGIQHQAEQDVRTSLSELVSEIAGEAETAAKRLMECHVALRAIEFASGGKTVEHWSVETAAKGLTGDGTRRGLVLHAEASVPVEIVRLLAPTGEMGLAVRPRLVTQVRI